MFKKKILQTINSLCILGVLAGLLVNPFFAFAQTVPPDLQSSIDAKNAQIQALEQEIAQFQNQVNQIQTQANTLQSTLNVIGKNQKSLQTNISVTNKKIERDALTIKQNQKQIGDLGEGIVKNTSALSETIRSLNRGDQQTIIELLASRQSVSEFLRDIDDVAEVQSKLKSQVFSMQNMKSGLEVAQVSLENKKKELLGLQNQLTDQKKVVDAQVAEKDALLKQTKNQESEYQALLADRKKQVEALNAEIFEYESRLKFTLNTKALPGVGALGWPLAEVVITQRFGKTVDAKRLYVSGSHSGVDFRAATGTAVYAVADGTVIGTGNTDTTCYKASFGKWVFIRHNNGLSTVYGHLSLIKALEGQEVKKGDLIGYSGSTGHATGPHLHLTVMATDGVNGEEGARVAERPSVSCKGKSYRMPIAPTSAYLDPLLYFPKTNASMFKNQADADANE